MSQKNIDLVISLLKTDEPQTPIYQQLNIAGYCPAGHDLNKLSADIDRDEKAKEEISYSVTDQGRTINVYLNQERQRIEAKVIDPNMGNTQIYKFKPGGKKQNPLAPQFPLAEPADKMLF